MVRLPIILFAGTSRVSVMVLHGVMRLVPSALKLKGLQLLQFQVHLAVFNHYYRLSVSYFYKHSLIWNSICKKIFLDLSNDIYSNKLSKPTSQISNFRWLCQLSIINFTHISIKVGWSTEFIWAWRNTNWLVLDLKYLVFLWSLSFFGSSIHFWFFMCLPPSTWSFDLLSLHMNNLLVVNQTGRDNPLGCEWLLTCLAVKWLFSTYSI